MADEGASRGSFTFHLRVSYTVSKVEQLSMILFDHPFDATISRNRDFFLYRGMPDATFSLVTSLQRVCKHKQSELEADILDNFAKYAELVDSSISTSIWRKMILGQHHGLPTRLLDWTKSPLIALNFATTEGNMDDLDKRDCVVWRIDVNKLHQHLPEKYGRVCAEKKQTLFTVDMVAGVCDSLPQYDADMGETSMLILEPPSMDSRMMNQYSFFSVMPSSAKRAEDVLDQYDDDAVRYVINKNLRWEIRDFLDQADVVLHACVPDWHMDQRTQNDPLLMNVYKSCLQYVVDNDYHSIGFPLLATGNKGYPVDTAWRLCMKACTEFMSAHQGYPLDISICVLNEEMYLLGVYFLNEANGVSTSSEELEYLKQLLLSN